MDSENAEYHFPEHVLAQIAALWTWSVDIPVDCDMLYHYYKGHTLKKVVKKKKLIFRLAAAETFPDKMEGKAVEVYYDLALESLMKEKRITEDQFFRLSGIDIPQNMEFMFRDSDSFHYSKGVEYEEYIICFSKAQDDLYMYETYTADSDGYCLHLFSEEIEEIRNLGIDNHAVIKLIPVLYGSEATAYIKRKIVDILSDPVKAEDMDYYINSILHYVHYAAKRNKFAREKEVRLVVFLPKNCAEPLPNIEFEKSKTNQKYIYLSVPSDMLFDVTYAPYNAKEEVQETREYLENIGYSRMLDEEGLF